MIGNKYLHKSPDEEVYGLYEQEANRTNYLGRVLVNKYSVLVFKGNDKIALTWAEVDLIYSVKPEGAVVA